MPEFTNLEKVTQNAVVKSNCIVYPVLNLKRSAGAEGAPHGNCKLIIQLDIPRAKIGQRGAPTSKAQATPTHGELSPTSGALPVQKRDSLALHKQATSIASAVSMAGGPQNDTYARSCDSIKQLRLVTNCFLLALEQ